MTGFQHQMTESWLLPCCTCIQFKLWMITGSCRSVIGFSALLGTLRRFNRYERCVTSRTANTSRSFDWLCKIKVCENSPFVSSTPTMLCEMLQKYKSVTKSLHMLVRSICMLSSFLRTNFNFSSCSSHLSSLDFKEVTQYHIHVLWICPQNIP
jgi:hypothetical protein